MASHHQTDTHLRRSLEALGLPLVVPEPEVSRAAVASIQCRSLASIIERLINDSEPLLDATRDGTTVTVRERGGDGVMRFTVESGR